MSHDPARMPSPSFPQLTPTNHRITSPADPAYNCAAWAAGDTTNWWEPGAYWPDPTGAAGFTIADLIRAFQAVGFTPCPAGDFELGFEKIAVYVRGNVMTHAARQLPNGKWTSKLGPFEDIEHDTPDDIAGGAYGQVVGFMKRPVRP